MGRLGATVAGTDPRSTGGHPKLQLKKRRLQMNKFRFTINALAVLVFTLAFASFAQAQATRTWVSGVGDDANPCSRTAPCKTFAGAISKTAAGGEIDALDSGGFGAVTITKAITIDGDSNLAGILAAGTNGVIINAGATDVVQLRNLSINGATTGLIGISILAGQTVLVENCVIFGFRSGSGRGISDTRTTANAKLFVVDTIIKNNSVHGLFIGIDTGFVSTVTSVLDRVRSIGNTLSGGFFGGGTKTTIRDSVFSGNGNAGVQISQQAGGTTVANLISSEFSHNSFGVFAGSTGGTTRIADVTITDNSSAGTSFSGGTIETFGNNNIRGNGGGAAGNGTGLTNVGPQQ
jgi:hypothetical protein